MPRRQPAMQLGHMHAHNALYRPLNYLKRFVKHPADALLLNGHLRKTEHLRAAIFKCKICDALINEKGFQRFWN